MSGTHLLRLDGLSTVLETARGPVRALDRIELDLTPGTCHALVGESGSGKSLTALSIMRLLPEAAQIEDGRVLLEDEDLLELPEAAMRGIRGRRVAMVFQEPSTALNPVLTVGRQIIEVVLRHAAVGRAEARARAIRLLEAVGIPDPDRRFESYPFQLSGGLRQRVMIAAALAGDPEVLIADEATTALDVTIQAQILELLARLQSERNMALLLITHDLGIVASMAQRVSVLYAGEIVEQADCASFLRAPQHPYSRKLFDALPSGAKRSGALETIPGQVPSLSEVFRGCRFANRCDQAIAQCSVEIPPWLPSAGGGVRCHLRRDTVAPPRTPRKPEWSEAAEAAAPLLEVRDLKVHFPIQRGLLRRTVAWVRAVDGISLTVSKARTLALVGESGCGKTTAGKAIVQLLRATQGEVRLQHPARGESVDLTRLSAGALKPWRSALQIVFQDPYASLNPRMRIAELLEEGMLSLRPELDGAARRQRMAQLLEQVGLADDVLERYPHEFSGGQRQRLAIARALAVEPRLLVCDEPTSALDVSVQAQILNLLQSLQQAHGLSYLFITHNLAVVEYLAHDVAVMYLGRIVEQGPVAQILRAPRHPYTQALLSAIPDVDRPPARLRLPGEPPSPVSPPSGCHFHPRCPQALPACRVTDPPPQVLEDGRTVRCLLYGRAESGVG